MEVVIYDEDIFFKDSKIGFLDIDIVFIVEIGFRDFWLLFEGVK